VRAISADGSEVHYEVSGAGEVALVLVHGWQGNARWWDAQRDALAGSYTIVAIDLVGHGQSSTERPAWTAEAYAEDIVAVVAAIAAPRVVLVGHSMSGAYVVAAAKAIDPARLAAIVLVDTLKNLDQVYPREQREGMYAMYRADYAGAVATMLPKFLFAAGTPAAVRERLSAEFLRADGDTAVKLLAPLYEYDARPDASALRVPVRGIDTDLQPHDVAANRKYFADYALSTIPGFGHYPMLECPDDFTARLRATLADLGLAPAR
jgi:pimeloyl-ACP methyl ester carboxylesterase